MNYVLTHARCCVSDPARERLSPRALTVVGGIGDQPSQQGVEEFQTMLRSMLREELAPLHAVLKEHLGGRALSERSPGQVAPQAPESYASNASPGQTRTEAAVGFGSEAQVPTLPERQTAASDTSMENQASEQGPQLQDLTYASKTTGKRNSITEWKDFLVQQCAVPPTFERVQVRNNCLSRLVHSSTFAAFSGTLIMSNAVFIGIYTAFTLSNEYARIDGKGYEEPWWINVQIFNVLFFLEIMIRMFAERKDFFFGQDSGWNLFDAFVVLFSMSDFMWIITGESPGAVPQVSYLRMVRVFRVIQTFRLFRLPFFSHLRMMTNAMALSAPVGFWGVATFAGILYIFAVAFALGVARQLQKLPEGWAEDPLEVAKLHLLRRYFGNMGDIFLHLYMAITGGVDWEIVYLSMAALNTTYKASFIVFSALMFFLVINIVVGMVIERAFKVVRQDRDFWIAESANQSKRYEERVRGLFYEMDLDVSGTVSWEEFSDTLNNPHVEAYLSFVELDTANLFEMFQLLDKDGSGTIEVDEFIDGIHELRGNSTKVQLKLLRQLVEDQWEVLSRVAETVATMQAGGRSQLMPGPRRSSICQVPNSGTTVQFRGMSRCTESQGANPMVPRRSVQQRHIDGTLKPLLMDSGVPRKSAADLVLESKNV